MKILKKDRIIIRGKISHNKGNERKMKAHSNYTSSDDRITFRGDLKLYLPKSFIIFILKELAYLKTVFAVPL